MRRASRQYYLDVLDRFPKGPAQPQAAFGWIATAWLARAMRALAGCGSADSSLEQDALRRSHEQLRVLSARLESVREEERARLAYAIHDELGQIFTGLKMDVVWLQRRLDVQQQPLLEKTQAMCDLIDSGIQWVRHVAGELRPIILDNFGLVAAIDWQLREFQARTGVQCTLDSAIEETALDADGCTVVYRIFQEILTNVSRHAGATRVDVALDEAGGQLMLDVRDNGRGITRSELQSPTALGLLAMRERARLLSGVVEIGGVPGEGTTITLRLPLPE